MLPYRPLKFEANRRHRGTIATDLAWNTPYISIVYEMKIPEQPVDFIQVFSQV